MNSTYQEQIAKLNSMGKGGEGISVPFKETKHPDVMLYTALNKRIGPLSIANARHTMDRWFAADLEIYLEPRTPEQVEEYKKSDKYKKLHQKHLALRAQRHKMSTGKRGDEMVKMIAEATGQAVSVALEKTSKGKKSNVPS